MRKGIKLTTTKGFNGSSSWIALNAKIVHHLSTNIDNISPFHQGESPRSFDGQVISSRNAEYLPDRAALEQAAMTFFRDINSVIFILDQEKFYAWLDEVYSEQDVSTSILAIVYLVMALLGDETSSFEIARSYMNDVIEESSLNSVRAIMLMVRLTRFFSLYSPGCTALTFIRHYTARLETSAALPGSC